MTISYHQVIWDHVCFSVTKKERSKINITNNFSCMDGFPSRHTYKSNIIPIITSYNLYFTKEKKTMMKNFITFFCKQNQTPKKRIKERNLLPTSFLLHCFSHTFCLPRAGPYTKKATEKITLHLNFFPFFA